MARNLIPGGRRDRLRFTRLASPATGERLPSNGNADSNGTALQMLNRMTAGDKADSRMALWNEPGNRHLAAVGSDTLANTLRAQHVGVMVEDRYPPEPF